MLDHLDKNGVSKTQSLTNDESKKQSNMMSGVTLVDNRPEAITQLKLQSTIQNQMNDQVNINDDIGLEKEVEEMGEKAMQLKEHESVNENQTESVIQNKKSNSSPGISFLNNRPESMVQRKMANIISSPGYREPESNSQHKSTENFTSKTVQRLKIVGPDNDGKYKKSEDGGAIETNNLNIGEFLKLLKALIDSKNFSLINAILMDLPFDTLKHIFDFIEANFGDNNSMELNLVRMFYNNRRPSNLTISFTPETENRLAPEPENPDITNLTEVEVWHEEALDNARQGVTKSTLKRRQKKSPKASVTDDMNDFMEDHIPLRDHLISIRNDILSGLFLVRRISLDESQGWTSAEIAADPKVVFMKGKESMKAFVVDGQYSFKDKSRDKDKSAYAVILKIRLTPKLKEFFLNFLYANMKNMMGSQFTFNPQFKFEQGGVTILIPKAGWSQFMSFVGGNFFIETPDSDKSKSDSDSSKSTGSKDEEESKSQPGKSKGSKEETEESGFDRMPRMGDEFTEDITEGDTISNYNLTTIRRAAHNLLQQGMDAMAVHRELHDKDGLPHHIIERVLNDLGHHDYF